MKHSVKSSSIDEFLNYIGEMQKLHNRKDNDKLDRVIEEAADVELSETELELAAAAQGLIPLPDYIKIRKNV